MTPAAPLISTLENYLRLTTAREEIISTNMANIDTPGYHTHDINFQSELSKAMSGAVHESAYGAEIPQIHPVVQDVSGLIERADGNNVSLEREGMLLSETQLQYQVGVQLLKDQFHQIISAIGGVS